MLIPLYIAGCSNSEVKPKPPVSPSPQAATQSADGMPSSDSNLIQETSSADWVFHQENAVNPHGELYTKETYIMKKDSGYIFNPMGQPKGVGSFTKDEFIYETFGIEYHYPLAVPINKSNILFDLDNDGEKEWLQDDI